MPNNPYVEQLMVADGGETVDPTAKVKSETIIPREGGGGGTNLDNLSDSTNAIADADLIVSKESGGDWVKKTALKIWNYISGKLGLGSGTTTYLRNDGTWAIPPDTTYNVVSASANGLCPQTPNDTTKFLRGDGTWDTPPVGNVPVFDNTTNGLVPAGGNNQSYYILRGDGTWSDIDYQALYFSSSDVATDSSATSWNADVGKLTSGEQFTQHFAKISKMMYNVRYLKNKGILDMCYPVGSIYISTKNVSPATFLGGTWASLNGNYMLRAASSGVTFNSNSSDGGASTVTLTAGESGYKTHMHNITKNVPYGIPYNVASGGTLSGGSSLPRYGESYTPFSVAEKTGEGAVSSHTNLPPYKNVYMWERTA